MFLANASEACKKVIKFRKQVGERLLFLCVGCIWDHNTSTQSCILPPVYLIPGALPEEAHQLQQQRS